MKPALLLSSGYRWEDGGTGGLSYLPILSLASSWVRFELRFLISAPMCSSKLASAANGIGKRGCDKTIKLWCGELERGLPTDGGVCMKGGGNRGKADMSSWSPLGAWKERASGNEQGRKGGTRREICCGQPDGVISLDVSWIRKLQGCWPSLCQLQSLHVIP